MTENNPSPEWEALLACPLLRFVMEEEHREEQRQRKIRQAEANQVMGLIIG